MNIKSTKQDLIDSDRKNRLRESSHGKDETEKSRIAILNGWIFSMLGIIAYCLAMLETPPEYSIYSSLLERGWMGSAAASFLIVGVGLWLYGTFTFLRDARGDSRKESESYPF